MATPEPSDPQPEQPASAPKGTSQRAYLLFLGGMASWFGSWGMQNVLFQWLVVEELGASPQRVGGAQMAVLIPSLLFLMVGGAVADRPNGTAHVINAGDPQLFGADPGADEDLARPAADGVERR